MIEKTPTARNSVGQVKTLKKHKLNKYDKLNNSNPASSIDASHKNSKRDLNFIQINTCKGNCKQATNDLVIFAKNYTSLIMLVRNLVYKIPYRRAPRLAYRLHRPSASREQRYLAYNEEPYVNGKNIIPKPSGDIGVVVDTTVDLDTRPRGCIYHHRSLTNKLWRMDDTVQ